MLPAPSLQQCLACRRCSMHICWIIFLSSSSLVLVWPSLYIHTFAPPFLWRPVCLTRECSSATQYLIITSKKPQDHNKQSKTLMMTLHMKVWWFIMHINAIRTFQLPVSFFTPWAYLEKAFRRKNFSSKLPCMYIFKPLYWSIFDTHKGVHT